MRHTITFKSLFVAVCLLLQFNLQAQTPTPDTIHVETAGTLPTLIAASDKYQITDLTLTGNLNGTDIRYIREMAGRDVEGNTTNGKLAILNLADATIVSGGSIYYDSYSTSNDTIQDYAFKDCTKLTHIITPKSVTAIEDRVFYGCTGLTNITLSNGVKSIGHQIFYGCSGLTHVTIPNSVIEIDGGAFSGCPGLNELIVSEQSSTYSSSDGVLFNKDKTTLVSFPFGKSSTYTIPNGVTEIREEAFVDCTGLTDVTIPSSVTTIGEFAFLRCTGLTNITIPNSVTKIEFGAFQGCTGLTNVTIPNSITTIGNYIFAYCIGLTDVTIPNNVTKIGDGVFAGCIGLTNVTIPNSVTSIGDGAFSYCFQLTKITIPNSVTNIGNNAFAGSTGLTEIHSDNPVPPHAGFGCFLNVDTETCKLYVPKGSSDAYKAAPEWKNFKNIIEKSTTAIDWIGNNDISIFSIPTGISIETTTAIPVSIYNLSGQKVYESKIQGNTQIKLERGIYIVKVENKSTKVMVK